MALACQEARGGVEADPARPWQIGLRPGMEIGEIGERSWRAIQRLVVRAKLHQVTRHEAGGETEPTQDLHQQPGAVTARPEPFLECFVRGLHAGFHAGGVGDRAEDQLVQRHEEVDNGPDRRSQARPGRRTNRGATERAEGSARRQAEVRCQLAGQSAVVAKWVARR